MLSIEEIKTRVVPISKRYGLKHVYLFGSYARGEATEDSDVDLRIGRGSIKDLLELGGLYMEIQEALETEIDMVATEASDEDFLSKISVDEVLLYAA